MEFVQPAVISNLPTIGVVTGVGWQLFELAAIPALDSKTLCRFESHCKKEVRRVGARLVENGANTSEKVEQRSLYLDSRVEN